MASPYAQRGGSSGSTYARTGSRGRHVQTGVVKAKPKKKDDHGGVLGFVENLGEDIAGAVVGLPMGVVETVRNPVKTAKGIASTYAKTYGPLAHGDVSKFLHELYSHPLGPILDVATIVTAGAGGVARAGKIAADAGMVAKTSRLARAGRRDTLIYRSANPDVVAKRFTATNPVRRARQKAIKRALDRLPYETKHIGEAARYAREAQRLPRQAAIRLTRSKEAREYNKAVRNLSNEELAALHLIGNDFHPLDYAAALRRLQEQGEQIEPATLKVLENRKVVERFENPDKRMMRAVDAAEALSKLDARVKIDHGILGEEAALARPGKHRSEIEGLVGSMRPTPARPFYVPDVLVQKRVANAEFQKMGGGAGVARPPGTTKQNRGILLRAGQLALHPDLLGPEFLSTIKYGLADDIHATLMSGAARISAAEARVGKVPKGWVFVPREVMTKVLKHPETGVRKRVNIDVRQGGRSQKIHPLIRAKGQSLHELEELLPTEEQLYKTFTANDIRDAATLHGDYLIVPETLMKEMVGEFHRSTSAVRKFLDAPTKVWRALVLGFRVGFLTNNLVGNHLLYAIHAAGVDGLRAYLNAVKREHGSSMVRSLLEDKEIPPALRQQFMEEFFPEQVQGTFGRTQSPVLEQSPLARKTAGKKGRRVARMSAGLMPLTQSVAETNLRRALVETMIRKSPEFKQVYKAMPRQTRDFEAAAKKVLKGDGGAEYQRLISEQVDNVLGNYLNLSPFERNVLRGAFPFYGWYRAIMRITTHLALDTPGRADLLVKLGEIGAAETTEALGEIPDYLRGLIPIGDADGDTQKVLTTQGLNPFATVSQLGAGAAGLLTGQPGETGRALSQLGPNPLLMAAMENIAGKDLFTGRDIEGGPGGLPGAVVRNVAAELPQTRLVTRPETKLYGKPTPREALLAYLGVPLRRLDKAKAREYARR